jgi:hypothetical protein
MLTYLNDSDTYQSWNGSAWVGIGGGGATNAIINGAFEINQRNFSSSTASSFGFDRWNNVVAGDGTATFSSQTFTPGSAPIAGYEASNFQRILTSGQTAVGALALTEQRIESVRSFAGQTVTVSFLAKAATGTPEVSVVLVQNFGPSGSANVNTTPQLITLSTDWARYTATIAVPSISGKTIGTTGGSLNLVFWVSAGSNFDSTTGSLGIQNNTFDIWGVQLEAGSVATPFRRNANSLQGELAACQRYYWQSNAGSVYQSYASGHARATTAGIYTVFNPVTMRTAPTAITVQSLAVTNGSGGFVTATSATLSQAGAQSSTFDIGVASGLTVGQGSLLTAANTTSSFIGVSAEI